MKDPWTGDNLGNAPTVGFNTLQPTLCIGLDLAWFGGSAKDISSQYDFLAAAAFDDRGHFQQTYFQRIRLLDRDSSGSITAEAIASLISKAEAGNSRVVLAVDAPLQSNRKTETKQYRSSERYFSAHRKRIDKLAGGSNGWHPNIQPGALLAERVQKVMALLEKSGFKLWSGADMQADRVVFECFPAEAIWSAKRMGRYPESFTSARAKAYKAQKGNHLNAAQVRSLVEDTLLDAFKNTTQTPDQWGCVIEHMLTWMLHDETWKKKGPMGHYSGGKWLDDVVDSALCLATAISYALNRAHVWQDPEDLLDGHIVGPGMMQELITGRSRPI